MPITCGICSESFVSDSIVCTTLCGHLFHEGCLCEWFIRSDTCPNCRTVSEEYPFRVYLNFQNQEDEQDVGGIMHQIDDLNEQVHLRNAEIKEKKKEIKKLKKDKQEQNMSLFRKYSRRLDKLSKEKRHQVDILQKKYEKNLKSLTREKNDLREQLNASRELVKDKDAQVRDYNKKYISMTAKHLREEEKCKNLYEDLDVFNRTLQRVSEENLQLHAKIRILENKQQRANLDNEHRAQCIKHIEGLECKLRAFKSAILEVQPVSQPKKRRFSEDSGSEAVYSYKYLRTTSSDYSPERSHANSITSDAKSSNEIADSEDIDAENSNETQTVDYDVLENNDTERNNETTLTTSEQIISWHSSNISETKSDENGYDTETEENGYDTDSDDSVTEIETVANSCDKFENTDGDEAEKSGDEAEKSGDEAEKSGDEPEGSDDEAGSSGDEQENCDDDDNEAEHSANEQEKSDDESEKSDDESEKSDDESEKSDDESEKSDDESEKSGDEQEKSDDEAENSDSGSECKFECDCETSDYESIPGTEMSSLFETENDDSDNNYGSGNEANSDNNYYSDSD